MHPDILTPAPPIAEPPGVSGWKEVSLIESGEPLVPLGLDAPTPAHRIIATSAVYFGEHTVASPYQHWDLPALQRVDLSGTLITAFARRSAADALVVAQAGLPPGVRLLVTDAYRPLAVQEALYRFYYQALQALHRDWSADELSAYTQKYVSVPSSDPTRPSPHNTGGSIDAVAVRVPRALWDTLYRLEDVILEGRCDWRAQYAAQAYRQYLLVSQADMVSYGVPFDHGGEAASLDYYERLGASRPLTPLEERAREARRELAQAMLTAGFQPYAEELWHWNLGNQMAARTAGLPHAVYGAAQLSPANWEHEQMRRSHWRNLFLLSLGYRWDPPRGLEQHYQLALDTATTFGSPRNAWGLSRAPAEKIAPVAA